MSALVRADWRAEPAASPAGRLQALAPELRLVLAAAFALVTVLLGQIPQLLAALALAGLLAVLARLPLARTLRRMLALDGFMLPLLLVLPLSVPGVPVARFGPFALSVEGLAEAARILLTANATVLAVLALAGTIEPARFGHACQRLRLPAKLVTLLLFTVRYIAVLQQEYRRLRQAMRARAFRASGSRHSWRSFGHLFGMLLVKSFERAERVTAAMRCRGFTGRYYWPEAPPLTASDWRFGLLLGLATALLLASEALA